MNDLYPKLVIIGEFEWSSSGKQILKVSNFYQGIQIKRIILKNKLLLKKHNGLFMIINIYKFRMDIRGVIVAESSELSGLIDRNGDLITKHY